MRAQPGQRVGLLWGGAAVTRGQLRHEDVRAYLLAGHAVLTFHNPATGGRFTFKVQKAVPREGHPEDLGAPVWFVKVLVGPENTRDYRYLGIIHGTHFRTTLRAKISVDAPSFKAFDWLWRRIDALPEGVEVWHEGRCGRCGRVLTVPESIERGIGPECAERGL